MILTQNYVPRSRSASQTSPRRRILRCVLGALLKYQCHSPNEEYIINIDSDGSPPCRNAGGTSRLPVVHGRLWLLRKKQIIICII
jgi:hypothetical protein